MPLPFPRRVGSSFRLSFASKYDLRPGTEVAVVDYGGVLALVPAMAKPIRPAAGMLKGETSLTGALMAERRRERSRGR